VSFGGYTHVTRASGTILTAAIYNNDHQNHIINQNPQMTGAYSDTLSQFQLITDPGDLGSENLAPSLAGEIERLRYQVKAITGEAQWYIPPSSNLKGVAGTPDGGVPLQKLAYTNQGNILMRTAAGLGAWQQSTIPALTELAAPAQTDWVLGSAAAGGPPVKISMKKIASDAGVVMPQGRLTLGPVGSAFLLGNILSQNTICYTPYSGLLVPIFDGTSIRGASMGGALTQLTTDNTKSPAACAANTLYDIYFWMDGTTPRISRGWPWSGSGRSAQAAVARVAGIVVNNLDITNGPLAQQGTYLGTIRTNSAAVVDFCAVGGAEQGRPCEVGIYNYYHRANIAVYGRNVSTFNVPIGGLVVQNGNDSLIYLSGMEQCVSMTSVAAYQSPLPNEFQSISVIQTGIAKDGSSIAAFGETTVPFNGHQISAKVVIYDGPGAHTLSLMNRSIKYNPGDPNPPIPGQINGAYNGLGSYGFVAELWY
jgi:hypothetical protein